MKTKKNTLSKLRLLLLMLLWCSQISLAQLHASGKGCLNSDVMILADESMLMDDYTENVRDYIAAIASYILSEHNESRVAWAGFFTKSGTPICWLRQDFTKLTEPFISNQYTPESCSGSNIGDALWKTYAKFQQVSPERKASEGYRQVIIVISAVREVISEDIVVKTTAIANSLKSKGVDILSIHVPALNIESNSDDYALLPVEHLLNISSFQMPNGDVKKMVFGSANELIEFLREFICS